MNSCAGGWTCRWCVPISAASWSSIIELRSSVRTSWLDIYSISRTHIPATTCIQQASGCTNGWCMHWYTWSVRMYIMTMQAPTSRTYWNSWCTNLILGSNNVARQPKKWISKNFEKPPFFGFPKNRGFSVLLKILKYSSDCTFVIVKSWGYTKLHRSVNSLIQRNCAIYSAVASLLVHGSSTFVLQIWCIVW